MSDSSRRPPRSLVAITAGLAVVAAVVLGTGGAIAVMTGVSMPWLVGVAVILILSLTWLARQHRR